MEWFLENEKLLQDGFYYKLVADGMKTDTEPFDPTEYLQLYYEAFSELSTCIQSEGGRIPFTSILEYFRIYKIDGEFENFLHIIRKMETTVLKHQEKKREAKNAELSKKNNNSVRRRK